MMPSTPPPRAPTGTAARLFPFCLGWTGQNGYFRDFQHEISGDNRFFVFMDILAILGIFAPDFRRYSVGRRRFGRSGTGKAGVCPARFRGGNASKGEIFKKAPNSACGTFFPFDKGVPYTFCLSGGFSRVCGAFFARFSASLPRPFPPNSELPSKKRMPPPEKLGMSCVPSAFPARWQEAGLRKFFCCGKPSTDGKGKPGFRKEARGRDNFVRFLAVFGGF